MVYMLTLYYLSILRTILGTSPECEKLVDTENSPLHLFAPMANLLVCPSFIHDGVETTSDVSSSVYPLTTMVTNYLAPVLTEGSLTRWAEDGRSCLVGCVANSTCNCISFLVLRYCMTCPRDRTNRFSLLDFILYQPVVCGCTRSTYWE